jgi:2-iminobutanoate/2-iminopropanoate deaminase
MTKTVISTPNAPQPLSPYSQAVRSGQFLFLTGQGGFDPVTRQLVSEDASEQTRRALQNMSAIIEAAGGTINDLVSVRIFLSDHADFAAMNDVYQQFFSIPYPARTTVTAGLGAGMKVEIDGIAAVPG